MLHANDNVSTLIPMEIPKYRIYNCLEVSHDSRYITSKPYQKTIFVYVIIAYTSATIIFQLYHNALRKRTVMVQLIYAYLTFVTVDQKRNNMVELIHAQKDIADVVRMMNVRFQKLVGLENAKVSNFKYPKTQIISYLLPF